MAGLVTTTILHVTDPGAPNPWFNGIAVHHDRTRFRHLVATFGPRAGFHTELEARGVQTFTLGITGRRSYPAAVVRLARLLRQEHVDILQTHLFEPSFVGLVAAHVARTPVRIVSRHHADVTTVSNKPVHRWIDRRMALDADRVMAVSSAVVRAMTTYEGVPASHITVASYGYEFDELRPVLSVEERGALRASLGGDDRILLVTVGRLDPFKGHADLLRAAPAIVAAHPNVQFVFVGGGPERSSLSSQAAALGVADHVTFLGYRPDALRLMEAADLVVHPSLSEAFCNVLIEALAVERPLIATDVGGAREQLDDGETGVLVPPGDPVALQDAVVDLLGRPPDTLAAMGHEGRRRTVERFSFPTQMARYEALYDELLSAAAART
jgi:glycosyltransferase involved in cell wall biosynthesis